MIDEEIFNEWKSEQYKDQSTEEKMEFVEHLHTFPCYFKKAFIAGLKSERQEKWHSLRKDPTDLPTNYRYVWTNVGAGYYDDDGDWRDDFGRLLGVIAWCEPKFEE